jgi:hypothetical protein
MDPNKLREAARELGASDGRLLLQMGIYDSVQVAKEALQRLANIEEIRLPAYFATVADIHERDRHMSGIPSQMGRETAEKLIRAHKHRGELLDGIKVWVADMEVARSALAEEQAEFKEFRRRLLGALKPVGIEKGLLDIELAAVRTQELATARAKIEKLEAGIVAYRKRSATAPVIMDLDEADAWEASFIDVDGKSTDGVVENKKRTFTLDEEESAKADVFIEEHNKKHAGGSVGAIGGRYTFTFTSTSLGGISTVCCACGGEKSLTNFTDW